MHTWVAAALVAAVCTLNPSLALAQRFDFERSFPAPGLSKLDASTVRGKIEIVAGEPGRVVVTGTATVRVGWDVPANAVDLARQVAAAPPIEQAGATVRLRTPSDRAARQAVTVSYQVRVPPDTEVQTTSESGATSVRGVGAAVDVRTQSGAIQLHSLAGIVTVSTGSGAVTADAIAGALAVSTASSSITGIGIGSSLRIRTQSGEVNAALTGNGDVDVETGSSAIRLRGVRGGLTAKTQSGRIAVQGAPGREWIATTGSSSVEMDVDAGAAFSIDATSRSGSVAVDGSSVTGPATKRDVKGTVNGGGPLVRIASGSGSIRVLVGAQ